MLHDYGATNKSVKTLRNKVTSSVKLLKENISKDEDIYVMFH